MTTPRQDARVHRFAYAALAILGGVAWAACFGVEPLRLLPWLALTPLILICRSGQPFRWGLLHGFVSWFAALPWLVDTVHTFGGLPVGLSWVLYVLLALYLGLDHGLFAWLGQGLARRGGPWALLGLPSLWVVFEIVRGLPFGGFPWNLAAYAWVDQPGALVLSSWVGAFGVSWCLLFANVGLALSAARRRWFPAVTYPLLVLLVLVLAGRFVGPGGSEPWLRPTMGESAWREAGEVRIIQPNAPIASAEETWANYRRLIDMSMAECVASPWPGRGPRLLIWPESAAFPFRYPDSPQLRRDIEVLAEGGCHVVFNTVVEKDGHYFNAVLTVGDDGVLGTYAKRRLVPYGEYVPLAETFSFIGTLARQAGNFKAGEDVGLLPWADERLGMAICYEVVFPASVAEQVRAGASVLTTVTNDAWYGDSDAPWQHFRAARFRAAENRRPMLRAALTGVSGIIDAQGQVTAQLGVGEVGVLSAKVHGEQHLTPYTRAPWALPLLSFLTALFAIVRGRLAATSPTTRRR